MVERILHQTAANVNWLIVCKGYGEYFKQPRMEMELSASRDFGPNDLQPSNNTGDSYQENPWLVLAHSEIVTK